MYCSPYGTTALNTLQSTALLANILTLFVGLMLIIDANLEAAANRAGSTYDLTGRGVISVLIMLLNISVVGMTPLVKLAYSDAVKKQFAKVFSSKIQKMEPKLLPDFGSKADVIYVQDEQLKNMRAWA